VKSTIVIPARLASTRLPRKLLLRETGKPLIQHTYEAAQRARRPSGLCVAADHEEIAAAVRAFGGEVRMTSPDCASGADRVAEVARGMPDVDIFVNVQGDEPELAGAAIDHVVELLEAYPHAVMSTLATPIRSRSQLDDPACVKVVFAQPQRVDGASSEECANGAGSTGGPAIYFSRSPIPHARQWDDALLSAEPPTFFQHIGLYAYRRDFLLRMASLPRTPLEKLESLEQLRALEWGYSILVGVIREPTIGVDTPEDYRAFVERTRQR
jgi:3-deoxy-manno-octulosonate cytidylyltransferase (CMP-KDO synthetase)